MNGFTEFAARKVRDARAARIHPLRTLSDVSSRLPVDSAGSDWTRRHYDGPFHVWRMASSSLPAVSLVFVQSRDGNTGAENPADLGGGDTDKHLIYEGLSRVAADAVLAGATTAAAPDVFFSVWHPELVSLRQSLGLPRHPAQVIVTGRACFDPEATLMFNVPGVPLYVIGSASAREALAAAAGSRPWVTIVPLVEGDLAGALTHLRTIHGIRRVSVVGGRATATSLIDAGVVQDIYLTTTERSAGEPGAPFYAGDRPPGFDPIVSKKGTDPDAPFLFEHLALAPSA